MYSVHDNTSEHDHMLVNRRHLLNRFDDGAGKEDRDTMGDSLPVVPGSLNRPTLIAVSKAKTNK